jgi:hypothetical protein
MTRPLYAYAYANVSYDDASAILAADPQHLLQSTTDSAMEHADRVVTNLHVEVAGFDLGRDVVVELGTFEPVEQLRSALPVRWQAATGHLLFPTVDATIEVAALSLHPPMVQLTLNGTYDPPLGPFGHVLDRSLTHRMAEAVIHRFVHELAARLEARVAEVGPGQVLSTTEPNGSLPVA